MPVRIRLARHGQRHTPLYHIVAINATKARNAKPLEKLGEYDPIPRLPSTAHLPSTSKVFGGSEVVVPKEKRIDWDVKRINYWLGVGAEPTRSVVKLLERVCRDCLLWDMYSLLGIICPL
jgi:small subunit ribosomal protein S16